MSQLTIAQVEVTALLNIGMGRTNASGYMKADSKFLKMLHIIKMNLVCDLIVVL